MKTALLYTFWTGDDIEMLLHSVNNHKEHFDSVIICYQETSNKGSFNIISSDLIDFNTQNKYGFKLIDFEPDLNKSTKENERVKHNEMIQIAKKDGCTHFVLAAADHFYLPELIQKGKELMISGGHDVIITKMRTYYKHDNWMLWPLEDYYMPFFHKMHPNTEISRTVKYPFTVDPSVKVNTSSNCYVMPESEGLMDHYSMVRNDIQKKFRNAAASIRWSKEQVERFISEYENAKLGDEISYFGGRKLIDVNQLGNNHFLFKTKST